MSIVPFVWVAADAGAVTIKDSRRTPAMKKEHQYLMGTSDDLTG
jgi:hypothetical protein